MKANIPQPVHESYLKHRRELKWKILAPVIASVVICFVCSALVYVATFSYGGDVARWGQISTIWLSIPTILFMLIFFALVGGMVFLLTKLLSILPRYTGKTQDIFHKIKSYTRRGADYAAMPIIFIDSLGASINRIFGRK